MLSLEDAQARIIALARSVEAEAVPLAKAVGRTSAEAVLAQRTQPATPLSAMDGYAVSGSDPGPWRVVGESAAGKGWHHAIVAGQAVRIFTGAPLPPGADCVIMQEDVSIADGMATLTGDVALLPGRHVRHAGSDFAAGEELVPKGVRISPAMVGLAAMGGHATISCARPIWVAILSTGNELVKPGETCGEDQIPASNAVMLSALLGGADVIITDFGIVPDNADAIAAALDRASHRDVILTIGGASVGDHDLVQPALIAAGGQVDFWKVAMRPGKPLIAGRLGNAVVLGLPGNPVSAFVTAMLFARPLIAACAGAADPLPARQQARLASPLPANGPRTDHVRARIVNGKADPVGLNDSAALLALSRADALIVRPPNAPAAPAGTEVDIVTIA